MFTPTMPCFYPLSWPPQWEYGEMASPNWTPRANRPESKEYPHREQAHMCGSCNPRTGPD